MTNLIQDAISSPIFAGGAALGLFGGIGYATKSIWSRATQGVSFLFTSKITVTSFYNHYEDVVKHIGQYRLDWTHRAFSPADMADKTLSVGFGSGYALFEGTLISYSRSLEKTESGHTQREVLDITFVTRNDDVLRRFFVGAIKSDDEDMLKIFMHVDRYGDDEIVLKRKRSMASVFCNGATKDLLEQGYAKFRASEDRCMKLGQNYKFCALFYGPPGTGKTSLIHAFASEHNLDVRFLSSLDRLPSMMVNFSDNDLLVIEDIDALAGKLKRNKDDDTVEKAMDGRSIVHDLLNTFDGFKTPWGMKAIITTNHIDRLDPALLRDGRVDLKIEIGKLEADAIRPMFEAFYGAEHLGLLNGVDIKPRSGASLHAAFSTKSPEDAARLLAEEESREDAVSDY